MGAGKVGRNDPCPCGSGRKYKQCCGLASQRMSRGSLIAVAGIVAAIAAVLFFTLTTEPSTTGRQVWDPEHGHYHTVP